MIKNMIESQFLKKIGLSAIEVPGKAIEVVRTIYRIKDHQERIQYLKGVPDEIVKTVIKLGVYICLFTGQSLFEVTKTTVKSIGEVGEVNRFLEEVERKTKLTGKLTYHGVSAVIDDVIGMGLIGTDAILWIASLFNPLFMLGAIPNSLLLRQWNNCSEKRKADRENAIKLLKE